MTTCPTTTRRAALPQTARPNTAPANGRATRRGHDTVQQYSHADEVRQTATLLGLHIATPAVTATSSRPEPAATQSTHDVCGRRRSPATFSNFRKGQKPGNHGKTYAPTPPNPEQVLAILRQGSPTAPAAIRDRSLFGLVWRSGLRISEALALHIDDLTWPRGNSDGAVLVRNGKGNKRRISPMDPYGFELLEPWLGVRDRYPGRLLFPIVEGPTKGGPVSSSSVRTKLHQWARDAGVPTRCAPHQLRHAFACDSVRDDIPVVHVSKALGHSNLAITTTYLQGIAPAETLSIYAARPRPDAATNTTVNAALIGVGTSVGYGGGYHNTAATA